jgi:hypothetical protein
MPVEEDKAGSNWQWYGEILGRGLIGMVWRLSVGIGKGSVVKAMDFPSMQIMDRPIGAVDCKPMQAEKGRIPDKRAGELTRIWEVVDQAEPSAIDLLHRVVDIVASAIDLLHRRLLARVVFIVRSRWLGARRRIDCR